MLFIGHVHGPGHVIHCHMILKDGRPSNVVDIRSSDVNVFLFAVHYRLDGLVGPHFDKCSQFICVPIICSRRHFHEMIARHSVRFGARSAMVSVPPSVSM